MAFNHNFPLRRMLDKRTVRRPVARLGINQEILRQLLVTCQRAHWMRQSNWWLLICMYIYYTELLFRCALTWLASYINSLNQSEQGEEVGVMVCFGCPVTLDYFRVRQVRENALVYNKRREDERIIKVRWNVCDWLQMNGANVKQVPITSFSLCQWMADCKFVDWLGTAYSLISVLFSLSGNYCEKLTDRLTDWLASSPNQEKIRV